MKDEELGVGGWELEVGSWRLEAQLAAIRNPRLLGACSLVLVALRYPRLLAAWSLELVADLLRCRRGAYFTSEIGLNAVFYYSENVFIKICAPGGCCYKLFKLFCPLF